MGSPFDALASLACSGPAAGERVEGALSEPQRVEGPELAEGPKGHILIPMSSLPSAWFYLLRLQSGVLYPGATTDLSRRWQEHLSGLACRTTRLDPPVSLAYSEPHPTFSAARRREAQVKRWTRAKKEALAVGNSAVLHSLARRRGSR
jgi:putative endonuclease